MNRYRVGALLLIIIVALIAHHGEADYVICREYTGEGFCAGSSGFDLMNGTANKDFLMGLGANDVLIGDGGQDFIGGGQGDDLILGGSESDFIFGEDGNDIIMAGSDDLIDLQLAWGGLGDDTFPVLIGETSNCLVIYGEQGEDVVNLLGFGLHHAEYPFGSEEIEGDSAIVNEDPIAGGLIFIAVTIDGEPSIEAINGLPQRNPVVYDYATAYKMGEERCVFTWFSGGSIAKP